MTQFRKTVMWSPHDQSSSEVSSEFRWRSWK